MNLVVLGATGGTGRQVVEQALAAGHSVTALVRSPEKLTISHARLRVVTGAATETSAVSSTLEGADAIISTLGGNGSVITDSTRAIVAAADKSGVSRVVMLSTFAAQRDLLSAGTRLLTGIVMGGMLKDKSAGEDLLRQSDLDWTIVYASALSNGPVTGSAVVLPDDAKRGMSEKISRADVAAWMVKAATSRQYSRSGVGITGSTRTRPDTGVRG